MNKKETGLFFFLAFSFSIAIGQVAPQIEWQNTIGGNDYDAFHTVIQTSDGGYMLGGYSASDVSVDKSEESLVLDYWIVKVDSIGSIQWQNTIGGEGFDNLLSIIQTHDGGYLLGGRSDSEISGDKTEASMGEDDYWVVKLDSSGSIAWQNTIGGDDRDVLLCVIQTSDGGYLLGGFSDSDDSGDKTEPNEGGINTSDYWIVKLDSSGIITWQNTIGGYEDDELRCVIQTSDGGYFLAGSSWSGIGGDKTEENIGEDDYWVIKLDSSGDLMWQNTIGGNDEDGLTSARETSDGGYILGGSSLSSISGDKTEPNIGNDDWWIISLDGSGNIVWQNAVGGTGSESLSSVVESKSGGYLAGGTSSSSISGDKTETSLGSSDYWLVKLDNSGNISWQNTIGGSSSDYLGAMIQAEDGGCLLGGYSDSGISGDKSESCYGNFDYWILKTYSDPPCVDLWSYADGDGDGFGDPQIVSCGILPGYVNNNSDCDDSNPQINPGAPEICNWLDENCNGLLDEGLLIAYYPDTDDDGYGDMFDSGILSCLNPGGFYVTDHSDCLDIDALVNPSAIEICNGIDDNCNLQTDDGLFFALYYADNDSDGFGNHFNTKLSCLFPTGYVNDSTDCNDNNSAVNPDALEAPNNNIDDDCDGDVDEIDVGISAASNDENVVSAFPNPSNGKFVLALSLNEDLDDMATIEMTNLLGQTIFSKTSRCVKGKLFQEIELKSKVEEVYLLIVTVNQKVYPIRIICQQ